MNFRKPIKSPKSQICETLEGKNPYTEENRCILQKNISGTEGCLGGVASRSFQRKTKGQQLKGKIVSELFTLFHNFSHFFILFPPGLSPSKQRVLAPGEQKRRKIIKKQDKSMLHVSCCTFVLQKKSSA